MFESFDRQVTITRTPYYSQRDYSHFEAHEPATAVATFADTIVFQEILRLMKGLPLCFHFMPRRPPSIIFCRHALARLR